MGAGGMPVTSDSRSAPSPEQTLPRHQRITRRRDFVRAYEEGRKIHARYSVVFVIANTSGRPRLGVTATRRLGNAVTRNLMKRRVREIFRRNRVSLGLDRRGCDLVVNLKHHAPDVDFQELELDLSRALARASRAFQSSSPSSETGA